MTPYQYSRLYLASGSLRRKELLTQLGVDFIPVSNDFDETKLSDEAPLEYVERVALGKAKSAKARLVALDYPILAADTVVVLDGRCLGKPKDLQDAAQMLAALSANSHTVYTSLVVLDAQQTLQKTSQSQVYFDRLSMRQIELYCQTQEPLGKAGSYAIQGVAASL